MSTFEDSKTPSNPLTTSDRPAYKCRQMTTLREDEDRIAAAIASERLGGAKLQRAFDGCLAAIDAVLLRGSSYTSLASALARHGLRLTRQSVHACHARSRRRADAGRPMPPPLVPALGPPPTKGTVPVYPEAAPLDPVPPAAPAALAEAPPVQEVETSPGLAPAMPAPAGANPGTAGVAPAPAVDSGAISRAITEKVKERQEQEANAGKFKVTMFDFLKKDGSE